MNKLFYLEFMIYLTSNLFLHRIYIMSSEIERIVLDDKLMVTDKIKYAVVKNAGKM